MTDKELKELVASLAINQQETDIQMAKTDAQFIKTDAKIAKLMAEVTEQQKKTDIQLAKTDIQLAKTDAKIDRIATLVGNISNNQGDSTEEFFYSSLLDNTQLGDIQFIVIYPHIKVNYKMNLT